MSRLTNDMLYLIAVYLFERSTISHHLQINQNSVSRSFISKKDSVFFYVKREIDVWQLFKPSTILECQLRTRQIHFVNKYRGY